MKQYFKSLNEFVGELGKAKSNEEQADTLIKYACDRLAYCYKVNDIETAILLIKICKYINPRHFDTEDPRRKHKNE